MSRPLSDLPALACRDHTLENTPERLGWLEPVPDAERSQRDALWARLERDGYLYLKGLLAPEVSWAFRRSYFAQLAPSGLLAPGTDPLEGVGHADDFDRAFVHHTLFDTIVKSAEYDALCESLRGFFAWLYGDEVHLHRRKLIRHARVQDTWVTPAHYDLVYLRGGTENLLSAWIPLGDCPAERGGLVYLEGSHHVYAEKDRLEGGLLRAEHISFDLPGLARALETRWLLADYEAGDVVLHSPYLVHASLNNVDAGGRMRLSTDIRYQSARDQIDPRWQAHWFDGDGL